MSNDIITVHITYTLPQFNIPENIEISGNKSPGFWNHHGNKEFYKKLGKELHLLPEIIDLWRTGQLTSGKLESLTNEQKMLFETYIVNPVRISYNSHSHDFEIHDGRHRIALGLEKGIAVPVRLGLIKDFERASELTKRDEYYAIMQPDVKKQTLVDLIRDEQAYIIKNKERIPVSILSAKTEKIKQGINIYKTEDKIPHYYNQTEEYDER